MALVVLGGLALNFPLLSLFSREELVFGVPVLFFYLFLFWLVFVILIAWVVEGKPMARD